MLLGLPRPGWGHHCLARRLLLAGTGVGLASQARLLLPYSPLATKTAPDATPAQAANAACRLRLLEINVYMKNRQAAPLLRLSPGNSAWQRSSACPALAPTTFHCMRNWCWWSKEFYSRSAACWSMEKPASRISRTNLFFQLLPD